MLHKVNVLNVSIICSPQLTLPCHGNVKIADKIRHYASDRLCLLEKIERDFY